MAVSDIYLRHGETYVAMRETPYGAEDVLQQLIEEHPEMLGGEDAAYGSRVLVRREAGVSDREDAGARWSLDHLYVDARGIPTLVEVKRSSDTRGAAARSSHRCSTTPPTRGCRSARSACPSG